MCRQQRAAGVRHAANGSRGSLPAFLEYRLHTAILYGRRREKQSHAPRAGCAARRCAFTPTVATDSLTRPVLAPLGCLVRAVR